MQGTGALRVLEIRHAGRHSGARRPEGMGYTAHDVGKGVCAA